MTAIELLVPEPELPAMKHALGTLHLTTFFSHRTGRSRERMIVSPISALCTAAGRAALDGILGSILKREHVPLVFLAAPMDAAVASLAQELAHIARQTKDEPYFAQSPDVIRRIIFAKQAGAERTLIASATIEDDRLVVWSCEPRCYTVSIEEIPSLRALDPSELSHFEVSQSGSRIRWDGADVDLSLDTILEVADPVVRRRNESKARKDASKLAAAIRRFREERHLKQTDIPGLTDRQVRRIEEGHTVPRFSSLQKLAAAHGLAVNDYLSELAGRRGGRRTTRQSAAS